MKKWAQKSGFTIVELLIVIVVIAILAAITIVAYTGIQNRAKASAVSAAASQVGQKVLAYAPQNSDVYPTTASFRTELGLAADTPQATYDYYVSTDRKSFCISMTDTTTVPYTAYAMTQQGQTVAGRCVETLAKPPSPAGGQGSWTGYNSAGGSNASVINSAFDGAREAYRWTASGAGFATTTNIGLEYQGSAIPVQAGETYSPSIHVRVSKAGNYRVVSMYRNSSGSGIGDVYGPTVAVPANTWVKLSTAEHTAPGGTDRTSIRAQYVNGTSWSSGDWIEVSGVSTSGVYEYGDGNSENWAWVGSTYWSTSFGPAIPVQ